MSSRNSAFFLGIDCIKVIKNKNNKGRNLYKHLFITMDELNS